MLKPALLSPALFTPFWTPSQDTEIPKPASKLPEIRRDR